MYNRSMNKRMTMEEYVPPKASAPNFSSDDYKEAYREEKNGYLIVYFVNSGGRRLIKEYPLEGTDEIGSSYYPDGGCNFINGMLCCSFGHIDWQIPDKEKVKIKFTKNSLSGVKIFGERADVEAWGFEFTGDVLEKPSNGSMNDGFSDGYKNANIKVPDKVFEVKLYDSNLEILDKLNLPRKPVYFQLVFGEFSFSGLSQEDFEIIENEK